MQATAVSARERKVHVKGEIMNRVSWAAALAAVTMSFSASAQNASTPPSPCTGEAGFSDFDFWVGEWAVYTNDDDRNLVGHNSITKHHGDCLIKESWQSETGGGGFSINYYNSVRKEWRQVWVANGYSIDYTGGLNDDGAMVLEGAIYSYVQDVETPFRGTWSPQDDGSVIQHFDVFDPESQQWTVWFEGLYVRRH